MLNKFSLLTSLGHAEMICKKNQENYTQGYFLLLKVTKIAEKSKEIL